MPKIKAEIHKHNKIILKKDKRKHPDTQLYSCTNEKQSPLNEKCLTESIVYQANIATKILCYQGKVYLGVSESIFKVRFGNHKKLFTKQRHKNDTELFKEYWRIKQQNGIPRIK